MQANCEKIEVPMARITITMDVNCPDEPAPGDPDFGIYYKEGGWSGWIPIKLGKPLTLAIPKKQIKEISFRLSQSFAYMYKPEGDVPDGKCLVIVFIFQKLNPAVETKK